MKIYTRTGDKGQTSLFGGKRVSKASQRVDTYGTVDELNSSLGVVIAHLKPSERILKRELEAVQHDLLTIGSYLASPGNKNQESRIKHLAKRTEDFEKLIDRLTEKLPKLKNFILPGGGMAGSFLHQARTVCRRAERRIIAFSQKETVDDEVVKYLNRLSDLLFTMARFVNYQEQKKETIWSHK